MPGRNFQDPVGYRYGFQGKCQIPHYVIGQKKAPLTLERLKMLWRVVDIINYIETSIHFRLEKWTDKVYIEDCVFPSTMAGKKAFLSFI